MTKRNYAQFTCDYCGNATDYPCYRRGQSPAESYAKIDHWIIVNKKHFCTKHCYQNYKRQVAITNKLTQEHLTVKQLVKMLSKLDQEKEIRYQYDSHEYDSSACSLYWLDIYDHGDHYLMSM